jgi:hypothetical protein
VGSLLLEKTVMKCQVSKLEGNKDKVCKRISSGVTPDSIPLCWPCGQDYMARHSMDWEEEEEEEEMCHICGGEHVETDCHACIVCRARAGEYHKHYCKEVKQKVLKDRMFLRG